MSKRSIPGRRDADRVPDDGARITVRDVFDHAPHPMAVLRGPDHVFEQLNELCRQVVGRRPLIGRSARVAFPELDGQGFHELLDRVYAGDESARLVETRILVDRSGGGVLEEACVTFTCQPLHDADGRIEGLLLHGHDLTAAVSARRGLAEAADELREANERLVVAGLHEQELAEAADDAQRRSAFLAEASRHLGASFDYEDTLQTVAALAVPTLADFCFVDVLAADGRIRRVAWAPATPAELGMFDDVLLPAPGWEHSSHPVVHALVSGEPVVVADLTDARRRAIATSAEHLLFLEALAVRSLMTVPLAVGRRRLGAMTFCFAATSERRYRPEDLALAEDLAARAALSIENAQLYRELRQSLRVRDDILSTTAHDLRTPLTSIKGYAQLWRRRVAEVGAGAPLNTAALLDAMTFIDETATTMTRMIEELMDAARLQAGQTLELNRRPVDLVALVERVVADRRQGNEGRVIRFETAVTALVGHWDAARLERAVGNLLENAVKYSHEGQDVTVSLRTSGVATPGAGASAAPDAWAELTVRDEGIGIPAADQRHIFEWFHRGANTIGRLPGMGIGLAGTRAIVEQHGGTITVESEEGAGSAFTVRLPLAAPAAA